MTYSWMMGSERGPPAAAASFALGNIPFYGIYVDGLDPGDINPEMFGYLSSGLFSENIP